MTMFDPRTKLSEQVVQEVQRYFGDLVYGVIIPRTVRLSEAPGFGQPITVYDPKSKGAEAYRQLAREVALRPPPDSPMPLFEEMPIAVMTPVDEVAPVERSGPREAEPAGEPRRARGWDAGAEGEPRAEGKAPTAGEPATGAPAGAPTVVVEAEPQSPSEDAHTRRSGAWPPRPEVTRRPRTRSSGRSLQPSLSRGSSRPRALLLPGELPQRRVVVIDENPEIDIEAAREEPAPPPESRDEQRGRGYADIGATLDDERGRKRRWRMFRKGGD